jgi:hypothetical protein
MAMTKHTFLQQHHPGKPIIQIPKIHTRNPTLIVQLSVNIKCLIGFNLHLPHALTRYSSFSSSIIVALFVYTAGTCASERCLEFAGPRRAIAVTVAVVVAEEVVAAGFAAAGDCERLIDRGEEVFG